MAEERMPTSWLTNASLGHWLFATVEGKLPLMDAQCIVDILNNTIVSFTEQFLF